MKDLIEYNFIDSAFQYSITFYNGKCDYNRLSVIYFFNLKRTTLIFYSSTSAIVLWNMLKFYKIADKRRRYLLEEGISEYFI